MLTSHAGKLFQANQLLGAVLPNRLIHADAHVGFVPVVAAQETLVDQRFDANQNIDVHKIGVGGTVAGTSEIPYDRFGRFHGESADKPGQKAKEHLLGGFEDVVAPGDRVAQGLVPFRAVACPAGEHRQALLQPPEHSLRRQRSGPGGGQLDGKREPIETHADLDDRRGIFVGQGEISSSRLSALDEQSHRGELNQLLDRLAGVHDRERQRMDRVGAFLEQVEPNPTGDEHFHRRARVQNLPKDRRAVHDLLEVVDDIERLTEIIAIAPLGGAGVDCHADSDPVDRAPVGLVERALAGEGSGESGRGRGEGSVKGVAHRLEDMALMKLNRVPQDAVVPSDCQLHRIGIAFPPFRAAFDVGEEKRDGVGWQLKHHEFLCSSPALVPRPP